MPPRLTKNKTADNFLAYAKFVSDLLLRHAALCVSAANLSHRFFRKFCARVFVSEQRTGTSDFYQISRYMPPSFSTDDPAYLHRSDAKFFRKFLLGDAPIRVSGSDVVHVDLGKLLHWMKFASGAKRSVFLSHVAHVFFVRSKKQMIGVHAGANIALVADEMPIRDFSAIYNPSRDMGAECTGIDCNSPVSPSRSSCEPQHTSIRIWGRNVAKKFGFISGRDVHGAMDTLLSKAMQLRGLSYA